MRITLTDRTIESLTSNGTTRAEYFVKGYTGLVLRVSASDRKTWAFMFTQPKTDKRSIITFGTYPAMSLAEAREKWKALRRMVEDGHDPRDTKSSLVISQYELIDIKDRRFRVTVEELH